MKPAALPDLRAVPCASLSVEVEACQFAIFSAVVMPDLPRVNVEVHILPHPDRTRDRIAVLAASVQAQIGLATGTHIAGRMTTLAPEGYLALK